MAVPPRRLEPVVESTLECSVRACDRLAGGRIAETYLFMLDDDPQRVVCKVGGPSVRTGDIVEPFVVDLVDETTDLPVPTVLDSGTFEDQETRWALYEFRDGHTPQPYQSLEPDTRRRIVTEIGSMLGQLHATHQFDETGGLARTNGDGSVSLGETLSIREDNIRADGDGTDPRTNGGHTPVTGGGTDTLDGNDLPATDDLYLRDPDGLNFPARGRQLARFHPRCEASEFEPVLSHGDLFPGNLLVDNDGSITGLLDWGNAHVTTAGYALGRAEMRFIDWFRLPNGEREALQTALREGYERHRSLPSDYPALTGFYKSLWLAQSADRVFRHLVTRRGRRQLRRHFHSLLS